MAAWLLLWGNKEIWRGNTGRELSRITGDVTLAEDSSRKPATTGLFRRRDTLAYPAKWNGDCQAGGGGQWKEPASALWEMEEEPAGWWFELSQLTLLASAGALIQRRGAEWRQGWRGRLHPKDNGKVRNVLNHHRRVVLKHTQICPLKAVPIVLLTVLVLNLDCKTINHFHGTQ